MNKEEKKQKKEEITKDLDSKIEFLEIKITNLTSTFNEELKKLQDEVGSLKLQKDALVNFKIT